MPGMLGWPGPHPSLSLGIMEKASGACPVGVGSRDHKQLIRRVVSDSIRAQRKMQQDPVTEGDPVRRGSRLRGLGMSSVSFRDGEAPEDSLSGCGLNPAPCLGSAFCWLCGH